MTDGKRELEPRIFHAGASAVIARVRRQSADAFALATNRLLTKCSDILTADGFKAAPVSRAVYERIGHAAMLVRRADEAAAWINERDASGEMAPITTELAADTLGSLAVFHILFEEACARPRDSASQAKLMQALMAVGSYDAMLTSAEAGHFDDLAHADIRAVRLWSERASAGGVASAAARQNPNRERARADWAIYSGTLRRNAWAVKNCSKYGVAKSTLLDWIRDVKKASG